MYIYSSKSRSLKFSENKDFKKMHLKNASKLKTLFFSVKRGDFRQIDLMLDMYDVENICPTENEQIIHFGIACTRNKVKLVEAFLDHGMNVNICMDFSKDYRNVTPLHLAVLYQSVGMVKLLLNYGADFSLKDTDQSTPLHFAYNYATDTEQNYKIIHLILSAHAAKFSNPANNENVSHFHIACLKSDSMIVKNFLNNGVDINSCDNMSNTPLHMAVYNKQNGKDIIQLLLDHNAKVNETNRYGQTPLHKAVLVKSHEIIKLLMCHGAYMNLRDKSGCTPLIQAAQQNSVDAMQCLLKSNCVDINVKNESGLTAFLEVYSRDNIDSLKILLRYIPDLNFTDHLLQNNFDSHSYRPKANKILVMHMEKMRLIGFQLKKNNDYYIKIKKDV